MTDCLALSAGRRIQKARTVRFSGLDDSSGSQRVPCAARRTSGWTEKAIPCRLDRGDDARSHRRLAADTLLPQLPFCAITV